MEHLRSAVRFSDGIDYAKSKNIGVFVEIGPKPTLLGLGRNCVPSEFGIWLPSLRPKFEWSTLLECIQKLYVAGVDLDWKKFLNVPIKTHSYPIAPGNINVVGLKWLLMDGWTKTSPTNPQKIENASKV